MIRNRSKQVVAVKREGGSLSILRVYHDGSGVTDDYIRQLIERTYPDSFTFWRRINWSDVPASRDYRDAWSDDGSAIVHDMPKAREIHRDRIRARRKPMLEALDIEYQRADEAEDRAVKRSVATRKQRLRDATDDPRIDACQTVEELKQIDPLVDV
jgi:hypothetical protein